MIKYFVNLLSCCIFFLLMGCSNNGKIVNTEKLSISNYPVWDFIADDNDQLLPQYEYINRLEFYNITYLSDGLEVKAMMLKPKKEGNYPVILFNRGGNRDFSYVTPATLLSYTGALANEGYIIIASQLRGTLGTKGQDEFGGNELNDILSLTKTAKSIEGADVDNMGLFGWSRGGMMTYLALKHSNKFKTAIVSNGPTDLFATIKNRPTLETDVIAECIPNYIHRKEEALKERSAIFWPEKLSTKSSLLILTGKNDNRVDYQQGEKMYKKLLEIGYDVSYQSLDSDHFFTKKREELDSLVINWFNQKLKK